MTMTIKRILVVSFLITFSIAFSVFESPMLSGAVLIYTGDFESGNFSGGWGVQDGGLPGAAVVQSDIVRAGNFAAKLHIKKCSWNDIYEASEPTCGPQPVGVNRPRSQLIRSQTQDRFELDQEYWIGASMFIPEDWIFDDPGSTDATLHIITSPGGPGNGTAPPQVLSLRMIGNRWSLRSKGETAPATSQSDVLQFNVDVGKVERGQWMDWVFNFKYSYTDGFINAWRDGEQVYERTGSTISHNPDPMPGNNLPFSVFATYKPQWFNGNSKPEVTERTIYYDEIRIATGADGFNLVSPPQGGDFDGDLDVDGADFLQWQRDFGDSLDSSDLEDWEANFGTTPVGATSVAVPEPASWLITCVMAIFFFGGCPQRFPVSTNEYSSS